MELPALGVAIIAVAPSRLHSTVAPGPPDTNVQGARFFTARAAPIAALWNRRQLLSGIGPLVHPRPYRVPPPLGSRLTQVGVHLPQRCEVAHEFGR